MKLVQKLMILSISSLLSVGAFTSSARSGAIDILILHADPDYVVSLQTALNAYSSDFSSISLHDARSFGGSVPSLATLQQYEAVLAYNNHAWVDSTAVGNVLADFVDGGGGLVVADGALLNSRKLGGRFLSQEYYAITPGGGYDAPGNYGTVHVPGHDVVQGVGSFFTTIPYDGTTVTTGATKIASFSTGGVAVAEKTIGGVKRIDLGIQPPPGFNSSDPDATKLIRNSLIYVAGDSIYNTLDTVHDSTTDLEFSALSDAPRFRWDNILPGSNGDTTIAQLNEQSAETLLATSAGITIVPTAGGEISLFDMATTVNYSGNILVKIALSSLGAIPYSLSTNDLFGVHVTGGQALRIAGEINGGFFQFYVPSFSGVGVGVNPEPTTVLLLSLSLLGYFPFYRKK